MKQPGSFTRMLLRRRVLVLAAAACIALVAVWFGSSAQEHLSAGDEAPASAESMRARYALERDFGSAVPNMVLVARVDTAVDSPQARTAGLQLVRTLRAEPSVDWVRSYWSTPSPALRSSDGRAAMVLVRLHGGDAQAADAADHLAPKVTGSAGVLTVRATGEAVLRSQVSQQVQEDRAFAELLVLPATALLLLFVFRSAVAALLPVAMGALAVLGTAAVLRAATWYIPVSVFASSISYALGFALAVDYCLFVISRYREELAKGSKAEAALITTLRTAGTAVAFSAATVAASLAALFLFPLPILRSIAFAGITVVVWDAAISLLVLPAVLFLLGPWLDRLDVFARWRRPNRPSTGETRGRPGWWGRVADRAMRRPVAVTLILGTALLAMASPFARVEFGRFDDRLFPPSSEIGKVGQSLRQDFAHGGITSPTTVVLPGFDAGARTAELDDYAARITRLPDVRQVETASGVYEGGRRVRSADPVSAAYTNARGTWLMVTTRCEPFSARARDLAVALRLLPPPASALVGGPGALLADMQQPIADRLWPALCLVAAAMLALVLALTRRPVLALKALTLNALSLSATFGVLVYVFQDGNFAGVLGGFTATGTTDIQMPVLIFCIAFGLSMDYEVFLLARICEEHQRTGHTKTAVIQGLDRTAGLFTWAAVIFAVVMAALATSDLVLLKIVGVGLGLAVLLDATVIRGLLVPAVMALAGNANWWMPKWTSDKPAARRRQTRFIPSPGHREKAERP